MKHRKFTTSRRLADQTSVQECLHEQSRARFADWHNLPKPTWRSALRALAAPATRVHHYRNLRTAILEDAMRDLDCKERS